ncbi:TatD family deoxyribonuclease [bacterium]|nr:MAG: TatD family deoxyribonuclease [bacterium]
MSPSLIDTHTHVNFQAYREDADEVVERALAEGTWMINAGTQFETSRRAVEMAENYSDGVYAAVALHPIHLFAHHVDDDEVSFNAHGEEFNIETYRELVQRSAKVVAIGEFGLDYYRMPPGEDPMNVRKVQREVLEQHLLLSKQVDKPVMIHCRDAYTELAEILKHNYSGTGDIHCFVGTWEEAKPFLEMGYYIGLNGIITFDKTGRSEEVVKNLPLESILLETDAPYLSPVPMRGKRNEPSYVKHVAQKIAEIKGIDVQAVEEATTANARKLFRI